MTNAPVPQAGIAVLDITPPVGYRLHGHAKRTGTSDGVHDPLHLKVLTLTDGAVRLVVVTSDLIEFADESVARIRRAARERFGLEPGQLLISASHTHTGPCMSRNSVFMPPEHILPEYIATVEKTVIGGIRAAIGTEQPVTLRWGEDRVNIGVINRRLWTGTELLFAPNPAGPVDDVINVLRLDRLDGRPLALLFRYSCHPTTLDTELVKISADYPGAAQAALERLYPGTTAMFLQGCCGDVRPAILRDGIFAGGTFADAERLGLILAGSVARAAEQSTVVEPTPLAGVAGEVLLPVAPELQPNSVAAVSRLEAKYAAENREFADMGYVRKWACHWRRQLRAGKPVTPGIPMALQVLRLGEVTLVAFAAEVMAEYGEWIRQAVGPRTLVAGYANGDIGYLPTREALCQGGYEAVFHLFELTSAPFAGTLEQKVVRAARSYARHATGRAKRA